MPLPLPHLFHNRISPVRWRFPLLTTLLLVTGALAAFAQSRTISGGIFDAEDGEPLIGATVLIMGTDNGTITDFDGSFQIDVETGDVLQISYTGYAPQTLTVGVENSYTINLEPQATALDEVVVIGYGTSVKEDFTGAVSKLNSDELAERPSFQVAQAIQGKASGVQVVNSGQPGEQPVIRIRGTGTVLAGANPLYVVDGVFTDDISNLNAQDIESVNVLKDASSLAMYGLRGANGVVIITTKSGRRSTPSVSFSFRNGINVASNRVDMANARLFAEYANEAISYSGGEPAFDPDNLDYDTDWYDEILRTGYLQSYSAALSGGGESITYRFSLGYDNEEGILQKNRFERLTARLNSTYSLNDRIDIGAVVGISRTNTDNPLLGAFQNAYNQWPTIPPRFPDGSFGFDPGSNVGNPVAQLYYWNNETNKDRLQGSVFGEIEVLRNLTFKSTFNFDREIAKTTSYAPAFEIAPNQRNELSDLNLRDVEQFRYIWDNILTYRLSLANRHYFTFMAGLTSEEYTFREVESSAENVPSNPANWYIGAGVNRSISDDGDRLKRYSYLGRLMYNFDDRYLITASIRREASSKFAQSNANKLFPSVGFAWKVTSEDFMSGQGLFDFLKLRASWGRIGNDNIPSSAFILLAEPDRNFDFSGQGNFEPGIQIRNLKDQNLGWETTTGWDAGLEMEMAENRLSIELAYYSKLTEDVLLNTVISRVFGDADRRILTNLGDVSNRGVELSLNWKQPLGQSLTLDVGAFATYNKNNLESLGTGVELSTGTAGISEPVIRIVEDAPIGSFWLYETNGIFQSDEEIANSGITRWPQSNMKAGDLRFVDQNGDGLVNDEDRLLMGSHQPKFYFGLNLGLSVSNFSFSIDFYGNVGNEIYNGKKSLVLEERNIEASRKDRWRPGNPSDSEPRATQERQAPSDYYLEPGDFLRINTINLSYRFPSPFLDRIGASNLSVFLNAQNPVLWKSFSGFNVEFPGTPTDNGIEQNAYPQTSSYSIGFNLQF